MAMPAHRLPCILFGVFWHINPLRGSLLIH